MHIDTIIRQRFMELASKSSLIEQAKYSENLRTSGRAIWYAPRPQVIAWSTSVISLFGQVFGTGDVHTTHFQNAYANFHNYYSDFEILSALFNAAREDYEGGYIFSIQGLVKAEVLSDALSQAEDLLKSGYKDPACVLVGVALEAAIKHLATLNEVTLAKLDKMNADLARLNVYNVGKQKQITAWADLRNKAAHGDWAAYLLTDVQAMHSGVSQFIADFL